MIKVEDKATQVFLKDVQVCFTTNCSARPDTLSMITLMKACPEYLYIGQTVVKLSAGDTINIYVEKAGYEDSFVPLVLTDDILRSPEPNIEQTISLRRAPKTLKEAVVTASKVMMVNKGDTIIYNADYFQLAEGSMLDQLISRLPGVKLESGGRITVNGNFVSSLLINGKDFFKGDPTVALENLPAYMVDKVKAYQKTPDNAYITRDSVKAKVEDPWVIDVNLKRQYAQGWIANAEVGYGTEERYMARLFGLRFTDYSRLALFANLNNTNDNTQPGEEGTWSSFEPVTGLSSSKKGGLTYGTESLNHKTSFLTEFIYTYTDDDLRTETSSETFLTGGNAYGRQRNIQRQKADRYNWRVQLSHSAKKAYISWENYLFYRKANTTQETYSVEATTVPAEARRGAMIDSLFLLRNYMGGAALCNYYHDNAQTETSNWSYVSLLQSDIKLPRSRYISLILQGRYAHLRNEHFSQYALFTPQQSNRADFRNKYQTAPQREYEWQFDANTTLFEKGITRIVAEYTYRQEYASNARNLYRLDSLGGGYAHESGYPMGMLPSTADSLTRCTDYANTFHNTRHMYRHQPQLQAHFFFKDGSALYFILPLSFEHDKLSDLRLQSVRSRVNKHYVAFEPKISFNKDELEIEAQRKCTMPTLTYLLDVRDDSNPLTIFLGNTSLKPTDTYSLSANYSKSLTKNAQNYHFGARYNALCNAVGQSRLYDTTTGATTFTPRNINGNWNLNVNGGYARSLDKQQRLMLTAEASWDYDNSVDFLQTVQGGDAKSIVRNNAVNGDLALRYRHKGVALSFTTAAKWQHAESRREGFSTINSLDMFYGLTASVTLPWGMAFNTDMTLYKRSGYSDETMNTHEWIWNAEITKAFLKSKSLVVKLRGYDILHQRHNVQRTLNAQGRTETWYNTLPRYFMLTLSYRLNIQPKRNQ